MVQVHKENMVTKILRQTYKHNQHIAEEDI